MVSVARGVSESRSGSSALKTPSRWRAALGRVRRRVQWWKVLLGTVIVGLCVLGATTLLAEQNREVRIWVAEVSLQADQPLAESTISERVVSGTPRFEHFAVEEWSRPDLVGRVPAVDVPAGSVLHAEQFHDESFVPVPPGDAAVAVVVDRLNIPAGLSQGDTVLLIGVPGLGSEVAVGSPCSEVIDLEAVVLDISLSETGPAATVTVAVGKDVAADATWLASLDRVALAELR